MRNLHRIAGALVLLLAGTALAKQAAHFRHHGPAMLPDPAVTPGKIDPTVTREVACSAKWGETPRAITAKMKDLACMAYGLKPHCYGRTTNEIDHLISKELGGADDQENIWPQPYDQDPGAHQKDQVENWLHKQVCAGRMPLADAQQQIAEDWYAVYLKMKAEQETAEMLRREPQWIETEYGGYWKCAPGLKVPEVTFAGWRCVPEESDGKEVSDFQKGEVKWLQR